MSGNMTSNDTELTIDYNNYDYYQIDIWSRANYILSKPSYSIAVALGVVGIVANTLSVIAILKIHKSMTSYLRVVISLLAADLLVVFSLLTHVFITVFVPQIRPGYGPWGLRLRSRCSFMIIKAFNTMGLNVMLLNLLAMAINHYVASLKPFCLHTVLSRRRTNIMIISIWLTAAITGFSDFLSPIGELQEYWTWKWKFNYCEFIWLTKYQEELITFAIAIVCLLAMLYIYSRIYYEVRCKSIQDVVNRRSRTNSKTLMTTLLIVCSFGICWLPLCMFNVVLIIVTKGGATSAFIEALIPYLEGVEEYLYDLILLNTLSDPLIYAIRAKEVRRGYSLLFPCCCPVIQSSSHGRVNTHISMMDYSQRKGSISSGNSARLNGDSLIVQETHNKAAHAEVEKLIQNTIDE